MNLKNFVVAKYVILGIMIMFAPTISLADEIFVDCRNSIGPWNGSIGFPYEKIQDAINSTTTYDGDTIKVADCIYQEGIVISKNLTLLGSGPDVTTIDASVAGKEITVDVPDSIELTISGFRIVSPQTGIAIKPNANVLIHNNIINAQGTGILASNACGANVIIKDNTVDSCGLNGINLDGCYTNILVGMIYNNIITSNNNNGINVNSGHSSVSNSYNCVWNNGTNYSGVSSGAGSISENPRFIDPNTGNYRLQNISPCIDAGWPVKAELDPDGTRNNMGVYGGPGAAIFWPDSPGAPVVTDLVVTPAAVPEDGTVTIKATGRVRPFSSGQE